LTFNKDIGEVELTPSSDEWIKDISGLIKLNVEEIAFVPCFLANEIGHAREDGKVRIFDRENDPFIVSKLKDIEDLLRHLFKLPQALHKVIAQYGYILAIDIKQFKQNYKINDYPVEKYKEELEKN
jgi:rRNA processing protein Krr1/Pno1